MRGKKYSLYHQSFVDFFDAIYCYVNENNKKMKIENEFYISIQERHLKIVTKYYNLSNNKIKNNLLARYGLGYLMDHLYTLIDYEHDENNWYEKLLYLAKDKKFIQRQLLISPDGPNLSLKSIRIAFKASIEKSDSLSTAEMLLRYSDSTKNISSKSPVAQLKRRKITMQNISTISNMQTYMTINQELLGIYS